MGMAKGSRDTSVLGAFFKQTRKLRQAARSTGIYIVLDDDPSVQDYVQTVIEREGRQVRRASTMVAAKELIDETGPENVACIVVDAMLPDGHGSIFGDWLLREHPDIPFFYFSGQLDARELSLGVRKVQVLQKPCSVSALLEALSIGVEEPVLV